MSSLLCKFTILTATVRDAVLPRGGRPRLHYEPYPKHTNFALDSREDGLYMTSTWRDPTSGLTITRTTKVHAPQDTTEETTP